MKPGIRVEIPGHGDFEFRTLVSDYTGTQSRGGSVSPGVRSRLIRLSEWLDIHILTADTFGTVESELAELPVLIHRIPGFGQDVRKREFAMGLQLRNVAAFGNGNNDRLLLKTVREGGGLAVAVDNGEGCAIGTMQNASLFISGAENALDLLLETRRLTATLRF
jgi:soluble P-type ATPase